VKNPRTFLITFLIAATTAAVIVRFVQFVAGIIDFNTGFFEYYAGTLKSLHYIILCIIIVGFLVLAIFEKKRKTIFFKKKLGHFDDTDTAICGIMLLLAGFAVIYTAFTSGIAGLGFIEILTVMFGTAAYGFSGGVLLFRRRTYPSVGLAFLALSVYYVVRLVFLFLENHIILSMSEHLIRLLTVIMLALFYLSAGRMFMRAESKTTRIKACVFGFFAVTVAVSEVMAKLIFLFGSPSVMRNNLIRSASTKFIMPDMLIAAETIALLTILLTMLRRRPERVKAGDK
jgi:hypothetical protein